MTLRIKALSIALTTTSGSLPLAAATDRGVARQPQRVLRSQSSRRLLTAIGLACAAALLASAQASRAAADAPETVVFDIGTTVVSLDAQYIKPPDDGPNCSGFPVTCDATIYEPKPFNCVGITDYEGAEWFARQGQTSTSEWRNFKCSSGDYEISLNLRGTGSFDKFGFVDTWFDFKLGFGTESQWYSACATSTVDGPSDPADVPRWDELNTSVVGRCGDWQISAGIKMLEGYSAFKQR
jgi:hypothetical protein